MLFRRSLSDSSQGGNPESYRKIRNKEAAKRSLKKFYELAGSEIKWTKRKHPGGPRKNPSRERVLAREVKKAFQSGSAVSKARLVYVPFCSFL